MLPLTSNREQAKQLTTVAASIGSSDGGWVQGTPMMDNNEPLDDASV